MRTYKVVATVAVAALLLTSNLMAGGAVGIQWDNDGSQLSGLFDPFYSSPNGTAGTELSAGVLATTGDGFLIQLIALQGSTNYLLASATIGDNPGPLTAG